MKNLLITFSNTSKIYITLSVPAPFIHAEMNLIIKDILLMISQAVTITHMINDYKRHNRNTLIKHRISDYCNQAV